MSGLALFLTVSGLSILAFLCAGIAGTVVDNRLQQGGADETEAGVQAGLAFLAVYTVVLTVGLVAAL